MRPPVSRMFGHTVTVEAYAGVGAGGPAYASAVTVSCRINEGRRLARGPQRAEATDDTVIYMPADTVCPVGSRVTLPGDRATTVTRAVPRNGGSLSTPAHLEVTVQ